jgi:hypothetical protein
MPPVPKLAWRSVLFRGRLVRQPVTKGAARAAAPTVLRNERRE